LKTRENKNKEETGETGIEFPETEEEMTETLEQKLQKELVAARKQIEEEKDRCLRLNAEFDNINKRTLREKQEFIKYANEKLILDLINVFESLERGIENARKTENKDKLMEGMELVYRQFKEVLDKNGLVPIKTLGEKFDHCRHEALMQTMTNDYEDGTILEEFSKGYMLNGKIIRYSKVRVSKKEGSEEKEETSCNIENEVK
jgi:molecular chaperone GrpE